MNPPREAVPPPYLDCRSQDDADALVLKRWQLAVAQNVARRAAARAATQEARFARFAAAGAHLLPLDAHGRVAWKVSRHAKS